MSTPTFPTSALLDWYAENKRPLPWRSAPEPYRVWLSEIMAQQTRIDTMLEYYERFLARWPRVEDLAAAQLDEVLSEWSGLGYYSRARNLHLAAQAVVAMGGFPRTAQELRALPGVGPYTAGAIASVAFNEDAALVDGNVERVLCRWHRITEDPRDTRTKRRLWELAEQGLPPGRAGDYNQALMELGALICTPRSPRCGRCPVSEACGARLEGDPEALPNKPRKQRAPEVRGVCGVLWREGRLLMAKRPHEVLLGGLWELPGDDLSPDEEEPAGLRRALRERLGVDVQPSARIGQVRHVFTHRKLTLGVWAMSVAPGVELQPSWYSDAGFIDLKQLDDMGVSTLARKSLDAAGLGRQRALFAAEP
ncbi:MAG: A/G-specific adenine glycosylase [Alphaproteobacteria bacterium]|nr:A/G-specific adenine glycosylase [Alphaproteobacteria bacterium]